MAPAVRRFARADELEAWLAESVAEALTSAIAGRGQASLVVSGGRTPMGFFQALAKRPLDWSSVWITLADERWVDAGAPESNETLVRQYLLQGPARAGRFIPLRGTAATPSLAAQEAWQALTEMPRPFDAVILGMGADGHTASLFPESPALRASLRTGEAACIPATAPVAPCQRLSLTPAALLDARWIAVHATGAEKLERLAEALQPGPVGAIPLRFVLRQSAVPCEVCWSP